MAQGSEEFGSCDFCTFVHAFKFEQSGAFNENQSEDIMQDVHTGANGAILRA